MATQIGLLETTLKEYQSFLSKILKQFKEDRLFPSEVGTVNQGNKPISALLKEFRQGEIPQFSGKERLDLIDKVQRFLIRSLEEYDKLGPIRFDFVPTKPARGVIGDILSKAKERNQSGPVAQHLVGAKLGIRFPGLTIENFPYSAADEQSGRWADFKIGNTAFHVTVSPTMGHIHRCEKNIREGLSVFLLVVDTKIASARALLEMENLEEKVAVESIESFVGQNLSELAEFTPEKFISKLAELLNEYNRRILEVETDNSLLIDLPTALGGREE
jgi:hypothetical protein